MKQDARRRRPVRRRPAHTVHGAVRHLQRTSPAVPFQRQCHAAFQIMILTGRILNALPAIHRPSRGSAAEALI